MGPVKILLVQLFSNGDCLYATAIARQIKQDFPGCHLTWIISPSCKHILENNPLVDEVIENAETKREDTAAFRKFIKKLEKRKEQGEWDEMFVTHLMDANEANYDGCIRSAIFRGYGKPITVDITPVLRLTEQEKAKAADFAFRYRLSQMTTVILFEFAPLSGQSAITPENALKIAETLTEKEGVAVILSSARKIAHPHPGIIDGSVLSIRETAALTHHCHFLIGCSSGITWLTTSDGARRLPMVQLLNPHTTWVNPLSRDFERFGIDDGGLIELIDANITVAAQCVREAIINFENAKGKYHQDIPLHFKTTRKIVYNLLCYLQFKAIRKHVRINTEIYGRSMPFYKEVVVAFLMFPFKLSANVFRKKSIAKLKKAS